MSSPARDFAAVANQEHRLALQSGQAMVEHAIRCGEALLAAREAHVGGDWHGWLEANFAASVSTAGNYMRVAGNADAIRAEGITSLRLALTRVKGTGVLPMGRKPSLDPGLADKARALLDEGESANAVARALDVSADTVRRLTDPVYAERKKATHRRPVVSSPARDLDETVDRDNTIAEVLLELAPLVDLAPVDRRGLGRAVRALAYAEGEDETRAALKRVAAAAVAWEMRLSARDARGSGDVAELMSDVG